MQILGSVVEHGNNCVYCVIQSVTTTTTKPLTVVTVKRTIETIKRPELEARGNMT